MNSIKFHLSLLVVALFLLIASNTHAQSTQTFTNSGTFTVPAGVTQITVECWGAGGGGGSAASNGTVCGGGGGGAYAKSVINVTAGNTYNVLVGTGGSADVSGGNSSFNSTTVIAAGGRGATYNSSVAGAGGTVAASVGTIRYAGGNGANGGTNSGGGGGGAGSTGAGGNASGTTAGIGTSLYGGSGGTGVSASSDGNSGFNYGGGGSGSLRYGGPSRVGGSGANGLVMISWVVCTPPNITGTIPASRCGTGTVILGATASAGTINWYTASSGGVSIGTGTSFTTPSISTTTTYYVDATNNGCTTSTRTAVIATVNTIPTITGTTPASRCGTGTVVLGATASAGTINWYEASSGGVSIGTGTSFTTPSLSTTTTYYVDANNNGCTSSSRTAIIATINSDPLLPTPYGSSICVGSTATLSASNAIEGEKYKWYNASTGGTLLKTSADNNDNTYTTSVLLATTNYWVSILNPNGCESSRVQITATFPVQSLDDQTAAGTNSWKGHVYKRLDGTASAPSDINAFSNYYGILLENETFNQAFGGNTNCFTVIASESTRSIYTEFFAVKFRMNSTNSGIYLASIGSDDGARLTVDNVKVYDRWIERSFVTDDKILFQLNGNSNLLLEYYESGGTNQIAFSNFLKVPNSITGGTSQSICLGGVLTQITANNALTDAPISSAAGYVVNYQWQQATSVSGPYTNISGATDQNFTPTVSNSGTYYYRRNVTISNTNLGGILVNVTDSSLPTSVTINPIPTITETTPAERCGIGTVSLGAVASSGTINWYSASTGGSSLGTGSSFTTPSISVTTTYYVDATINECTTASRTAVTAVVNPILPVSIIITASENPVCSNTSVNYTATPTNEGSTPAYQWKVNGINVGTNSATYSYIPANNDLITCILTSNASPCASGSPSTSNTIIMTVNDCINKWKGTISNNWNTAANWTQNTVPLTDANIIFDDNPMNHCQLDQNRSVTNITNTQSTFRIVTNGFKLSVKGSFSFTNLAQIDASATNSTIEFAGNSPQTIPSNVFYNDQVFNLSINNSNNVSLNGTLILLNTISTNSGRLDATTNFSTVVYGGSSAQSIVSSSFLNDRIYNLTIDNSVGVVLNSDITIDNNLVINSEKIFSVSAAKVLSISGSIINTAGSSGFILQSNNSGTASLIHNSNNIGATLQRYISGETEAWHFLSSPVSNQSINETWTPSGTYGNGTGYDLYVWYEPTFCWIYQLDLSSTVNWNTVHPGAVFTPGRGYLYSFQEANPTKEFVGNLNNGTISYPVYFSATDLNLKGFNLIGNPYPSTIDWQSASGWSRSNLALSAGGFDMWIWNPAANNYGVFNSATGVGTNGINRYIAPTQGFFVLAASSGNLVMDNNVRVQNTNDWFKNSHLQGQNISLTVESEDGYGADEVMIDFGYPANEKGTKKLFSNSSIAPSLYMGSKGNYQSVQYLTNIINTPKVPLLFNAGKSGFYTLICKFDNNEFEVLSLKDRKTNTLHNFKESNTYRFQASKNDDANRFELQFITDNNIDYSIPAKVFSMENKLVIDLTLISEETELYVYDLVGRLVLQGKLTANSIHSIDFSISSQMVLIYLKNQSGSLKQKLVWTGD
jgi:hypothetical protein